MKAGVKILILLKLFAIASCTDFFVYPRILEGRADDGSLLLHIREGLILNLRKSSILAKDFAITSSQGTHFESAILNGQELEHNLYVDDYHQSSVAVNIIEGTVEVRGIINQELRIAPVGASERSNGGGVVHRVMKVRRRTRKTDEALFDELHALDIIERSSDQEASSPNVLNSEKKSLKCNQTNSSTETPKTDREERPEIFTVETCILTTIEYTCSFNRTTDLIVYLAILMNAVALGFADMTNPTVRFQLNEVFTNMTDKVINETEDGVNIRTTLDNMRVLSEAGTFHRCDVALLLSSKDMYRVVRNTTIEKRVLGMAFLAGVCRTYKVAIAEDQPHTYEGVLTTAHELAHLLGADHDNASGEAADMPGYPDSWSCPWMDGYLMSYVGVGRNKHRLSNCSMEQIRFVYQNVSMSCIQVSQKAIYTAVSYPGQNMTRREFCQNMHKGKQKAKPYKKYHERHRNCQIKCCWKEEWTWCQEHTMPEGLVCGRGKRCRRGVCEKHFEAKQPMISTV